MSEITYPYDDETMVFDEEEQRYILTPNCILNELNIDLNSKLQPTGSANSGNNTKMFLNRISMVVYTWIYSNSIYNNVQSKLLKYAPSARKIIKDAMKEQVDYTIFNGDLTIYGGVNFSKNSKTEKINDRFIAPFAQMILSKPLTETALAIIYPGGYTYDWVQWAKTQE